ncbi:hypothetical protein CTI12_AA279630 [Artemisia annua]|uniref:Uncharacterized protein n=1 Tax=Artemisia annua TaxID=35608 RepID=A0A2U1ND98_ARTAN|nr:hypothetical protein CTI12_AA279630 [Artemisia annua]
MGQIVLKFLEGIKENRVWYNGSYYALGVSSCAVRYFLNTIKRILDVLHCRIEDKLKSWASYLPVNVDKESTYGEHMNAVTVLLRTKYKNYIQAVVVKLISNMQASRSTQLQRILEETKEADVESDIRERMQLLCS